MSIIVQKFGGTSVANTQRIAHVAKLVEREASAGNSVCVVVSAMAGVTDELVGYAQTFAPEAESEHWAQEYDHIVSAGEQITSGLLAMALQKSGLRARAFLGWQLPIITDDAHSRARIEEIRTHTLREYIDSGAVAIIAGFQGICEETGRITTFGRGGSDTTAVALAAALEADRCDIYTDVEGVYTSDPRLVPHARKLAKIGYEETLEMASLGAKVLHTRCVELAMKHDVRVQVRSSFSDAPGTLLVNEEEVMERRLITGIAYSKNEAQITLVGVNNTPGVAASVFGPMADEDVNVDMIVQNVSDCGTSTDMTFTVPKADIERAVNALEARRNELKYDKIITAKNVCKVSVIGVGMRSHAGIAQKMFKTLADHGINILVISTSEIKISVLIEDTYLELALRTLHTAYGLDGEGE